MADLLPESGSANLLAAIQAAADTGNAQFLEFDLLSPGGVKRIHAEATSDPEREGEFLVVAREYSAPETLNAADAAARFAVSAASTGDTDAVFQELARVLAGLLSYDRLAIVTVDFERNEQHVIFSTDPSQEPVVPLSGTAVEVVARTGEPLVVPAAIPSVIVVPLRWSGETVAYMGVHSRAWESYGDHDLSTVIGLAPPVGAALAASQNRRYSSHISDEYDALRSISAVAATAGDRITMLEVAADRIYRLGRFSGVTVEAVPTAGYVASGPNSVASRGDDPQAHANDDGPGDPVWTIGAASEPLGSIRVRPSDTGPIVDADRRFVSECARRLADGIERLRAREEIERLKADLDCGREIDRVMTGVFDLDALTAAAANEMIRLAGPDSLSILIDRENSKEVRLGPGRGADRGGHGSVAAEPIVIPMLGPEGSIGRITASWSNDEGARIGVRRLEAMASRLAERVRALQLVEGAANGSRDARCLAEIEAAIEHCLEPRLALEEATSVLSNRFEGARVSVALFGEDRTTLSHLAVSGFHVPAWSGGVSRSAVGGVEEATLLAAGPISSSRATPDAVVALWPAEAPSVGAGTRSLVSVALPTGGAIPATLTVRSPDPNGFSDDDIDLLRRSAALITGPATRLATQATKTESGSDWLALAKIGQICQSGTGAEIPYARLTAELASLIKFDHVEIAALEGAGPLVRRIFLAGAQIPALSSDSASLRSVR
ncbi:MAG: GAF domain-containing protein [Chloroflexi bacterium]|nr:GAF domain-containing protein [Chloroflexota bacterium]